MGFWNRRPILTIKHKTLEKWRNYKVFHSLYILRRVETSGERKDADIRENTNWQDHHPRGRKQRHHRQC